MIAEPAASDLIAAFRDEVENFFRAAQLSPPDSTPQAASDGIAIFSHETGQDDDPLTQLAAARRWRAQLAAAGYAWLEGPPQYGGAGLGPDHVAAFDEVSSRHLTPRQDAFMVGTRIVAPTILQHGGTEVRERYLRGIHDGSLLACQLFSEPGAGSDLAGLRTRAVREGEGWVIDGAKVWTSQAQFADIGMLLARSEPDQPKHRGLTVFIVDMHDPAISVRPLRQMNGSEHFNEVFIDGLRVHDRMRVGEPGAGWKITISTLSNERAAIGDRIGADRALVERMLKLAGNHQRSPSQQRLIRDLVGRALISAHAIEQTNRRIAVESSTAGARNSVLKLARNRFLSQLMDVAAAVLQESAVADTEEFDTFAWGMAMLSVPGQRIAGGTDEIQRTILGERVLGLPPG